jgi:hypothetical protein
MERVFQKKSDDPGSILPGFEEAPAERLEHDLAARVEPAAGEVLDRPLG